MNSLPKTVTRLRSGRDLNRGRSAPESSTPTTRLPSQPMVIISPAAAGGAITDAGGYGDSLPGRIVIIVVISERVLSLRGRPRCSDAYRHRRLLVDRPRAGRCSTCPT